MPNSFAILWTIAYQAPLFMGLSQQEYCSGLPFPSPGYCPNQEIRLHLMHYGWNLHSWATGGTLHWGFSSVQSLSRVWLFDTPWTAACQASPSITNSRSLVKLMSIELVRYHLTISSSVLPFSSGLQSFPASGSFQMSQFFESGGQSIGVSASASVLPTNIQDWFPLGWTGWISLQSNRDSQESSPTPQFKSINSLVLSFLYGPTLTSIHDYGNHHSFDETDLCWQSNVSAF